MINKIGISFVLDHDNNRIRVECFNCRQFHMSFLPHPIHVDPIFDISVDNGLMPESYVIETVKLHRLMGCFK